MILSDEDYINSLGGTVMPTPVYKKINTDNYGEVFKFEKEGDIVEGIYQGHETVVTKMGESKLHRITGEKNDIKIWGNKLLNSKLGLDVPIGAQIRITFLGKVKGKSGFSYNNFSIEVAE